MRQRVPFIAQLESTECGAACVAMLATYHGHALPLRESRVLCNVTRNGTSALDLIDAAEKIGFEANAYRVGVPDLVELPLPAIVHWEFNHFVVLERVANNGAKIVDPAYGRRLVETADLDRSLSGVVIALTPTPQLVARRPTETGVGKREYMHALRLAARPLALALAATVLIEALGLASPLATRFVFDLISGSRQSHWLVAAGAILAMVILARAALSLVPARVLSGLRVLIDVRSTGAFVDRLMAQNVNFFLQRSAGDLVNRVETNIALAESTIRMVMAIFDALVVVAYAGLLIALDPGLGLAIFAISSIRSGTSAFLLARRREGLTTALIARSQEANVAWNALVTPEAIRAMSGEQLMALRFERRATERADAELSWRTSLDRAGALSPAYDGLLRAMIFALGGLAASHDHMTLGCLAAFIAVGNLLDRPMQSTLSAFSALQEIKQQLHRVDDIWDAPVRTKRTVAPGILRGSIVFENVTFRHAPSLPPTIENASFEIQPGQCVAVIGRSGAGKSTLASLLLGILQPTEGRVLLDGRDLSELDLEAVRGQMGVVMQDGHIFARTIRENLSLRDDSVALATIESAAQIACIHDHIASLEQGYATKIGAGGVGLSGGQQQRLRLARALSSRPKILVLDEATSSLDSELEATIQRGVDKLRCTRFVIAHRLDTVRNADRILVMDHGRIVDHGTFPELANRPGILREMLEVSFG